MPEIKVLAGLQFPGGFRAPSVSLIFLVSRDHLRSLAHGYIISTSGSIATSPVPDIDLLPSSCKDP